MVAVMGSGGGSSGRGDGRQQEAVSSELEPDGLSEKDKEEEG